MTIKLRLVTLFTTILLLAAVAYFVSSLKGIQLHYIDWESFQLFFNPKSIPTHLKFLCR